MRDFNERQSRLFLAVIASIASYRASELPQIVDPDVKDAISALAATCETAARGLIYEHRPSSMPADRLLTSLQAAYASAREHGGSAWERDAAVVLRRIEETVSDVQGTDASKPRQFLEFLRRTLSAAALQSEPTPAASTRSSRLIVP